jgi:phage shock protein A
MRDIPNEADPGAADVLVPRSVFRLIVCLALMSFALPCGTFSQASSDLAQKRESFLELQTDDAILRARINNNRLEYTIPTICGSNVHLAEPALTARRNYCNQKTTEFNSRDADLKAQLQKLEVSMTQLQAQISDLQRQQSPKHP